MCDTVWGSAHRYTLLLSGVTHYGRSINGLISGARVDQYARTDRWRRGVGFAIRVIERGGDETDRMAPSARGQSSDHPGRAHVGDRLGVGGAAGPRVGGRSHDSHDRMARR